MPASLPSVVGFEVVSCTKEQYKKKIPNKSTNCRIGQGGADRSGARLYNRQVFSVVAAAITTTTMVRKATFKAGLTN